MVHIYKTNKEETDEGAGKRDERSTMADGLGSDVWSRCERSRLWSADEV
jgi:hypothetical protein